MYTNVSKIWEHVVKDKKVFGWFGRYKRPDHERRFLQALHSKQTLYFIADRLAETSGRAVSVSSAFIDKNPEFIWPGPSQAKNSTGRGEIADLLVIVKRTDAQGNSTSRGCLVQAKVTDSIADYGTGKSSLQQAALYSAWPSIEFKTAADKKALQGPPKLPIEYALNPSNASPVAFLRILKISPALAATAPIAPRWTFTSNTMIGEPMVITDMPSPGKTSGWLEWLHESHTATRAFEDLDPPGGATPFVELVEALKVVLKRRQADGLWGASGGGDLVREVDLVPASAPITPMQFSTFSSLLANHHVTSASAAANLNSLTIFKKVDKLEAMKTALSRNWRQRLAQAGRRIRVFAAKMIGFRGRPFVVLRVEYGSLVPKERERGPSYPPAPTPSARYPGQSILDSFNLWP